MDVDHCESDHYWDTRPARAAAVMRAISDEEEVIGRLGKALEDAVSKMTATSRAEFLDWDSANYGELEIRMKLENDDGYPTLEFCVGFDLHGYNASTQRIKFDDDDLDEFLESPADYDEYVWEQLEWEDVEVDENMFLSVDFYIGEYTWLSTNDVLDTVSQAVGRKIESIHDVTDDDLDKAASHLYEIARNEGLCLVSPWSTVRDEYETIIESAKEELKEEAEEDIEQEPTR